MASAGTRSQLEKARKKTHKANLRNMELALENRRLREALWFYGDPENWFAVSVMGDPPCGPIYYDIDPNDDGNEMGRPTHGRLAREVLFGDDVDFEPPLDYGDWVERYGEPED